MGKQQPVMNVRPPTYRYTLRSAPSYGWRTGRLRDGRQAIVIGPAVVLFGQDGTCHGWHLAADAFPATPATANWQAAQGFTEQPISVERFRVPDECIFIEDLTQTLGEFLADPDDAQFVDWERDQFPKDIEEWVADGLYVFCPGGNDYYVSREGEVVSS